jgi:hypothetical protein
LEIRPQILTYRVRGSKFNTKKGCFELELAEFLAYKDKEFLTW